MDGERTGLLIGSTFGLVYVLVNAGALPGAAAVVLRLAAVLAYAGLLVVLFRSAPGGDRAPGGFTRGYWTVVVVEVAAIVVGSRLLTGPLGLPEGVLPWVTTVVGLHFLPLARLWRVPPLAWLGAALAACGLAGLALAAAGAGPAVLAAVAGVAPGVLLLSGSWWAASRRRAVGV